MAVMKLMWRWRSHLLFSSPPPIPYSYSSSARLKTNSSPPPTPAPFMASYLVERLGFSPDQALLSSKRLRYLSSPAKPDAVLAFLRQGAGLSTAQIRGLVRRRPSLLTAAVPSNLFPKLQLLQSLLPSAPSKDLASLVAACASAFGYSAVRLAASLDLLLSLLDNDGRRVAAALRHCPRLLTRDPDKVLSRNVDLLRARGGSPGLAALIDKAPMILVLKPESLESAFAVVEDELRITSSSSSYLNAVSLAAALPKEAFLKKLELLRSYGFGGPELLSVLRKAPVFLKLKDEHMQQKLEFLVNTVGFSPTEMLRNSWMLLFNLESRLAPRYELLRGLRSKGLLVGEVSFLKAFVMTRERFSDEYVDNFDFGEGAELVKSYMVSSSAKRRPAREDDDSR